jgi:hypothetical protein
MRARAVGAALLALLVVGPFASAAPVCSPLTEEQAVAQADVVFAGLAAPGPVAPNGVLATPAQFSVLKYLKGSGPEVVRVAGGPRTEGVGLLSLQSAGINIHPGEQWTVYAKGSPDGIVETSSCYGTHPASNRDPFVRPGAAPSAAPTPGPGFAVSPHYRSWPLWSAGGIFGLAIVMGIGWGTGRYVIGTR